MKLPCEVRPQGLAEQSLRQLDADDAVAAVAADPAQLVPGRLPLARHVDDAFGDLLAGLRERQRRDGFADGGRQSFHVGGATLL